MDGQPNEYEKGAKNMINDKDVQNGIIEKIFANKNKYAEEIAAKIYEYMPELKARYSLAQREASLQDTIYHLEYLAHSILLNNPEIFGNYIYWVRNVLESRNIPKECLNIAVKAIQEVLSKYFSEDNFEVILHSIEEAKKQFSKPLPLQESFLKPDNPDYDLAKAYLEHVLNGRRNKARDLIINSVDNVLSIKRIFINVFQPVQREIGRLWETNKISVAQEHYCTALTQMIISELYPHIFREEKNGLTLVSACVGGELHELGIRMVTDYFELNGWNTHYLGANTPIESIVDTVLKYKADLLAISATMSTHILEVQKLINQIRNTPAKDIKIMVGGYPFNLFEKLWQKVGANAYAADAETAVKVATSLIEG
ncbi:MAG: B12 binding domain protein [Promethearchaeota archaeon]|nr:MAG: B12 binding domain protein [Candidatus Lokiarchaeota archaeon]